MGHGQQLIRLVTHGAYDCNNLVAAAHRVSNMAGNVLNPLN
jgi:hypothetical protein